MSNIIVGFSKPKKWKPFAQLIMLGYGIPYDHVYIKFHTETFDRDLIYQASSTMVNFMSPDIFNLNNIIVQEFPITISDTNRIKLVQFAIDNAGKPYGLLEIVGLAYVRLGELFGKKLTNPFRDNQSTYVCSELVGFILEEYADIKLPVDVYNLNPKALYDYLIGLNHG